jgi:FkbM family methyltransferase
MRVQRILSLFDPRFLFRPDVFVKASIRKLRHRPDHALVKTSWGDVFEVDPRKFIGAHLYMRGVHELPVCEALLRLTDEGETVADIGANIGVMTSLLSRRVGPIGKVVAFEAHPLVAENLRNNVNRWRRNNVRVVQAAVSNSDGMLQIQETDESETNEGIAQIRPEGCPKTSGRCFEVRAVQLDHEFRGQKLALIKIDVEGHELAVLEGATRLLEQGAIRDIVFESATDYPNTVHSLLLRHGYSIFRLLPGFWRVRLCRPDKSITSTERLADFMATKDPQRAIKRFASLGWRTLSVQI